jgi:molybdenum cofactor guanylyltransferase
VTARPTVTAIVLAGGRSSRFGADKLAVEIDGRPLLAHALEAVSGIAELILLAGRGDPRAGSARVAGASLRTVPDAEPFAGPLAAVAGALQETRTDLAIVVGGDMPGLVPAVLSAMLGRLASNLGLDAVLLQDPELESRHRQVLPLALRIATVAAIATDAVRAGDRSLLRLVERLRSVEVPAGEWLALDPSSRTLLDVDRPGDLPRIHQKFR